MPTRSARIRVCDVAPVSKVTTPPRSHADYFGSKFLGREKLGGQDGSTSGAANRVVRERHETKIEDRVGSKRPIVMPIPFPASRSSRVCGRNSSSSYVRKGLGALGRSSFCGTPTNSRQRAMISSRDVLRSSATDTAAMCPSLTGTRMHCAGNGRLTRRRDAIRSIAPQIFSGSCSLFSSSPAE